MDSALARFFSPPPRRLSPRPHTRLTLRTPSPYRARPLIAAAIVTALILVTWPAALPAVRDEVTLQAVPGARLVFPAAYLALSPLYDVMDALTLLSVGQSIAFVLSLIVLYAAWRLVKSRRAVSRGDGGNRTSTDERSGRRILRESGLALAALALLLAFYAVAILAPRPMAALAMDEPEAVKVDVHSHTNASHDGRPDFDARANIAWHRAAGFDAAYITDHKSFDGAQEAMRLNPSRAGDGIVMLSGLEFIDNHNHINALGATAADSAWIRVEARRQRLGLPVLLRGDAVFIQTIPERLDRLPIPDTSTGRGLAGIELSDGAPRGIGQGQRDRALILRLADSLDLATVAGSNNHGWGRTAVAWSVLRIPGWRAMTPAELGEAIEARIRTARRGAVQVIERRSPDAGDSRLALAATLPAVTWNLLVTLSGAQRVSWILWSWILGAVALLLAARRRASYTR